MFIGCYVSFDYSGLKSIKFIRLVFLSVNKQFPKVCKCCGKRFNDFEDFIENTYISEHTENHNIQFIQHYDYKEVIAFRNCSCNSTMTIKCILEEFGKNKFFEAIKYDSLKLGISEIEVVELLRKQVLETLKRAKIIRKYHKDIQPSVL
jgi:hypothetical protein